MPGDGQSQLLGHASPAVMTSTAPIYKQTCAYDSVLALKNGVSNYKNNGSGAWVLDHSEGYAYDANRDWLTSANYGDGLANATPSWGYDDAGNRASDSTNAGTWRYDNLNRMTASPQVSGLPPEMESL